MFEYVLLKFQGNHSKSNIISQLIGINKELSALGIENLLNLVATQAIANLFTGSDSVKVKLKCNSLSKLWCGSVDSFQMSGRGMVVNKDFRSEDIYLETDAVSLDFSEVLLGRISLKKSTQGFASIKLSSRDINRAFKGEFAKKRLKNLKIPAIEELSGGLLVSFSDVKMELFPSNRVKLFANGKLFHENGKLFHESIPISMRGILALRSRRRIVFEEIEYEENQIRADLGKIVEKLSKHLANIFNKMIDLDNLELDGINLRLNRLETQEKMLLLCGYVSINHFPRTSFRL